MPGLPGFALWVFFFDMFGLTKRPFRTSCLLFLGSFSANPSDFGVF